MDKMDTALGVAIIGGMVAFVGPVIVKLLEDSENKRIRKIERYTEFLVAISKWIDEESEYGKRQYVPSRTRDGLRLFRSHPTWHLAPRA